MNCCQQFANVLPKSCSTSCPAFAVVLFAKPSDESAWTVLLFFGSTRLNQANSDLLATVLRGPSGPSQDQVQSHTQSQAITLIGRRQGQLQQRHRESALGCDSQHPCPPMDVGLSRRRAQSCGHSARIRIHNVAGKSKRFLSDSAANLNAQNYKSAPPRGDKFWVHSPPFAGWRLFAKRGPARDRPLAWAPRCK